MSNRPDPFWLCHEMRPIRQSNGVPMCASCNSEFIEILDSSVNPDPFAELPHPPVRPQSSPPSSSPDEGENSGFFQSMFNSLLGAASENQNHSGSGSPPNRTGYVDTTGNPAENHVGGRSYTFNFPGGGRGSVMFGTFGGQGNGGMGMMGNFGGTGARVGDQGGGLDSFFPGFPPGQQNRAGSPFPGFPNQGDPMGGQQDLLRALMQMLSQEGDLPQNMMFNGPTGRMNMGDYVMSNQGFDQILEQLMAAAGPQGPLPATEEVIKGLPKFKFDDESLEKSPYKDCPVCKDDFEVGNEVMKLPCTHVFHPDCLTPWLKTNGSCPVCRFSLVPDSANQRTQSTQPPQQSSSTQQTNPAPSVTTPAQEPAQPIFTNILNRLFGQSGTPTSPTTETTVSPLSPQQSPRIPTTTRPTTSSPASPGLQPPPPVPPPSSRPGPTTSGNPISPPDDDPPVPDLSSAIPEDYRERHRRRERDNDRNSREEERQYPSYFS